VAFSFEYEPPSYWLKMRNRLLQCKKTAFSLEYESRRIFGRDVSTGDKKKKKGQLPYHIRKLWYAFECHVFLERMSGITLISDPTHPTHFCPSLGAEVSPRSSASVVLPAARAAAIFHINQQKHNVDPYAFCPWHLLLVNLN